MCVIYSVVYVKFCKANCKILCGMIKICRWSSRTDSLLERGLLIKCTAAEVSSVCRTPQLVSHYSLSAYITCTSLLTAEKYEFLITALRKEMRLLRNY